VSLDSPYPETIHARSGTTWKADDSVPSPDASLVRLDRWQALTPEQRRGFAPLCPDLVVELASPSYWKV
jgi:Uma2 family endonuclease